MVRMISTSVKPHVHQSGLESAFSKVHRKLGRTLSLADLDFVQGQLQSGFMDLHFHHDGADKAFYEYQLRNDKPTFTAFYDIKHTASDYIKRELKNVRVGTSIWCMSELAAKVGARAFVVVENEGELPIHFMEISNGKAVFRGTLSEDTPDSIISFWRDKLHIM